MDLIPYPIIFSRKVKPTIWGGYRLYGGSPGSDGTVAPPVSEGAAAVSKNSGRSASSLRPARGRKTGAPEKNRYAVADALPPIGEIWSICERHALALNGPLRMMSVREISEIAPPEFFGEKYYSYYRNKRLFPLLCKVIDAADRLSVQVHPDDEKAHDLDGAPSGKTEMWLILDAAPDAEIVFGFSKPIRREEFEKAIDAGTVENYLNRVKVKAGDVFYIPAGRIHSIGAGILIAEIQQNCDITYRVYDYGRPGLDGKPRTLHIGSATLCTDFSDIRPAGVRPPMAKTSKESKLSLLSTCFHFTVLMHESAVREYSYGNDLPVLSVFMNAGEDLIVEYEGGSAVLTKYSSMILPACCEGVVFRPAGSAGEAAFPAAGSGDTVPRNETGRPAIKLLQAYHIPDRAFNRKYLTKKFHSDPLLSQFDM